MKLVLFFITSISQVRKLRLWAVNICAPRSRDQYMTKVGFKAGRYDTTVWTFNARIKCLNSASIVVCVYLIVRVLRAWLGFVQLYIPHNTFQQISTLNIVIPSKCIRWKTMLLPLKFGNLRAVNKWPCHSESHWFRAFMHIFLIN